MKRRLAGEIDFIKIWRKRIKKISGTREGGLKAAQTNKQRHGKDYYREIGRKGGHNGTTGGFASDKVGKDGLTGWERAVKAGSKGGKISKRGKATAPRKDKGVVRGPHDKEKGAFTWLFLRKGK